MHILLITLSKLIHQGEGIFIKKYNQKESNGGFIFTAILSLVSMSFFILIDLITDKNGININANLLIYAVIGGISYALASLLTYLALGCGSYVLSNLILSYGILVTVFHGLFVGENISLLGWIGIVLVVISLYFVKGNGDKNNVKITKKWIFYISLAVVFVGLFGIMQREQQRVFKGLFDNEFMIIALLISGVSLGLLAFIKDKNQALQVIKSGGLYALGAGFSNGGTNLLTLYVYMIAPMSFVAPVSAGIGIVLSFLFSVLIFKENFSKLQYFGVILGTIAIVLFNI